MSSNVLIALWCKLFCFCSAHRVVPCLSYRGISLRRILYFMSQLNSYSSRFLNIFSLDSFYSSVVRMPPGFRYRNSSDKHNGNLNVIHYHPFTFVNLFCASTTLVSQSTVQSFYPQHLFPCVLESVLSKSASVFCTISPLIFVQLTYEFF